MNKHAVIKIILFAVGVMLIDLFYLRFVSHWEIPLVWLLSPLWIAVILFFFVGISRGIEAYRREIEADKRRKKYVDSPNFKNKNG